jgi:hypothetical protein
VKSQGFPCGWDIGAFYFFAIGFRKIKKWRMGMMRYADAAIRFLSE